MEDLSIQWKDMNSPMLGRQAIVGNHTLTVVRMAVVDLSIRVAWQISTNDGMPLKSGEVHQTHNLWKSEVDVDLIEKATKECENYYIEHFHVNDVIAKEILECSESS